MTNDLPVITQSVYRALVLQLEELEQRSEELFAQYEVLKRNDHMDKERAFRDFMEAEAASKGAFSMLKIVADSCKIIPDPKEEA